MMAYNDRRDISDRIPVVTSVSPMLFGVVALPELTGDPPGRKFFWDNWGPLRQTTMLSGLGGRGKSLIAQQLATSTALGKPFLGMKTCAMRVLYVTCEDDRDELWRRQVDINGALGCSMLDLDGLLNIATWSGETNTALATFDAEGTLQKTERWRELVLFVKEAGVRLVVFDNVTDAMGGDMNDVHQVAQFVNLCTGLALEQDGAVLLLHHPNKSGSDWLGSVAWHNKVRSRILLEDGNRQGDPDLRKLTNPKANYAPQGGEILIRWHSGAFILDSDLPEDKRSEIESVARASGDNEIFLKCLREMTRQRRAVSEKPSSTYAPKVFADMPESRTIGRARLEAAMNRLFRIGSIERGELWISDQRKKVFGLKECSK